MKLSNPDPDFEFGFNTCLDLNISSCAISESSDKFMVTLYNPLAHATFQYVRVPVESEYYDVFDYRDVPVVSQIVPIPQDVQSLHYRSSNAAFEIVFLAVDIPPLGYISYFISKKPEPPKPVVVLVQDQNFPGDDPNAYEPQTPVTIGNKYLNLTFGENGLLNRITTNGVETQITQSFQYYEGAAGNNEIFANRSSGAYIFRPNGTSKGFEQATIRVVNGEVVDEVHQVTFCSNLKI